MFRLYVYQHQMNTSKHPLKFYLYLKDESNLKIILKVEFLFLLVKHNFYFISLHARIRRSLIAIPIPSLGMELTAIELLLFINANSSKSAREL